MNIFTIENNQINLRDLQELADSFAQTTTTPRGIGRVDFVEPVILFAVKGDSEAYERQEQAARAIQANIEYAASIGEACEPQEIEERQAYACKIWGTGGARTFKIAESEGEAQEWLDRRARSDMDHDCDAPVIYYTLADAEAALAEILAE